MVCEVENCWLIDLCRLDPEFKKDDAGALELDLNPLIVRKSERHNHTLKILLNFILFDPDTHLLVQVAVSLDQFKVQGLIFLLQLPLVQDERAVDERQIPTFFLIIVENGEAVYRIFCLV